MVSRIRVERRRVGTFQVIVERGTQPCLPEPVFERESDESVPGRVALPVIGRCFPEHEREIRKRLT